MLLDMTNDEAKELYEYCQVLLGGEDIEVDVTEKEIRVLGRRALKDYLYEINRWQVRNQFSNIMGSSTSVDFTSRFVFENTQLAQRISDWFASQARVGGKIPWKKDYITLQANKQVYNLAVDSGEPYTPGTRRIHKIMWFASPEIFGTSITPDLIDNSLFAFGSAGLAYGGNSLGYLGNIFDVVLLAQSLEMRNKIIRSEFFYNISGDIVELTPMPGGQSLNFASGSRVYYYYFDEADYINLPTQDQTDANELIANPSQVMINNVPYSKLNSIAKSFIDNYTVALAKYVQAAKWRKVRSIASPGSDYTVEFDYASLLDEAKEERQALKDSLATELTEKYDFVQLFQDKATIAEAAARTNKFSPRKFFIG